VVYLANPENTNFADFPREDQMDGLLAGNWPMVLADDWCGAHELQGGER
jgi:hypothetical protein